MPMPIAPSPTSPICFSLMQLSFFCVEFVGDAVLGAKNAALFPSRTCDCGWEISSAELAYLTSVDAMSHLRDACRQIFCRGAPGNLHDPRNHRRDPQVQRERGQSSVHPIDVPSKMQRIDRAPESQR